MQQSFTILGGMGTLATESYVRPLDKKAPIHCNQDYLNYLVVNHATVPDRTTWILNHSQPDPNETLIEDIKQQSLLDPALFVLICNTAHYFFDKLQATTEIPILSMLQETVNEIKKIKPDAKRVGLLATKGTLVANLYDPYIEKAEYELIKPTPEIAGMTEDLICHDIKKAGHSDGKKYHGLVRKMVEEQGTGVVISGYAELSFAEEMDPETKYPVADSQSIIVDCSLERALELR